MRKQSLEILRALSDQTRCNIVRYLRGHDEVSCGQLSRRFELSQPALSFHYGKLIHAKIVKVRKVGTKYFYQLDVGLLRKNGIEIDKLLSLGFGALFSSTFGQRTSLLVFYMLNANGRV